MLVMVLVVSFLEFSSESVIRFILTFFFSPLAFAFEVWKPFQEVWGRVGRASSVSSTEPFFPFSSLRKYLKVRIIWNQLGLLKETTVSITSIMNFIFIIVQYASYFYQKVGSWSLKKIQVIYLFCWEFTILFKRRNNWNLPKERWFRA